MQKVSGVSLSAYWVSTIVWDYISYQFPLWVIVGLIMYFDVNKLTNGAEAVATILLLALFGSAVASFTYCTTFFMHTHAMAQVVTIFINLLCGFLLAMGAFVMRLIESTRSINKRLAFVFRLFPSFCLADSFFSMTLIDFYSSTELGGDNKYEVFDAKIIG